MRKLILTTAAALSIAAVPAIAQQQTNPNPDSNTTAPTEPSVNTTDQVDQSTSANTGVSAGSNGSASTGITTGAGASVDFQGAEAAPAPPASYPLCRGNIQDECINPREAGKNFGNRPLKYWPGKPASSLK